MEAAVRRSQARSEDRDARQGEAEAAWERGDRDLAVDRAHEQYRSRLESVAYRILRNHADAEDVVQKVFIALRRSSFKGRSSLWTYLYRSAVNGSVNILRSRRRRDAAEQSLLEHQMLEGSQRRHSPEARVLEGEMMAAVAQALLQVKPQHRRVLVLRVLHGLSNTEIADREGIPMATVGTWLRRGREELRIGLRPLLKEMGRELDGL